VDTVYTDAPDAAAAFVRRGQIAAFPTETVYGLGADAFNPEAVQAIFDAKDRPPDNPLIVHVARRVQVGLLAHSLPNAARALMDAFFPGPLTLIVPKRDTVPDAVTAGLATVGVRMPRHPVAQAFLEACQTPVAAPSANRSGRPSPTTWEAVAEDLDGRIPCILKGDRTEAGLESTVVDCTRPYPTVLRPGAVPIENLHDVHAGIEMARSGDTTEARSPGTRHRHYAPHAQVHLVDHPQDADLGPRTGYIGLDEPASIDDVGCLHIATDVESYAHALFHFFRTCDAAGCDRIYAQTVPNPGWGHALNDRLEKAAAR
jgi:L-threonylcarbamoyladenylate synthase